MNKNLLAIIVSSSLIPSAFAGVVFNDTIPYINGSGNPNTGWVSDTVVGPTGGSSIELALRADDQQGNTPNAVPGTYTFAPGLVVINGKTRATWNYQFIINSDPTGNPGSVPLSTYDYYMTIKGPLASENVTFDVLTTILDSTYGNNTTTPNPPNTNPGTKANGATSGAGSASVLGTDNNVVANSENVIFAPFVDPNAGGVYTFDLYAVAAGAGQNGTKLDDVEMTVVVPEAQTYWAGALLMLPLGLVALRKFRKQQA